jgi:hypothetical protein
MLSTQVLRSQLDRYADGAVTSEALEEWLASESWDMRRWVPKGLQSLIEAMQSSFIKHADGELSAEALDSYIRAKREQLHRAAEVTQPLSIVDDAPAIAVSEAAHFSVAAAA